MKFTNKTNSEKLLTLIQANKSYRLKKALEAGFDSTDSFIKFLKKKESKPKKSKITSKLLKETKQGVLTDIVIAFDTTGSMASYIASVKKSIKTLIPKLFKAIPNLKIKIVAFGDYCDMDGINDFGDAYQEIELTNNQDELIDFIRDAGDTSGGDSDEFYELVIKKITNETTWRDSNKSVLLIGDSSPHNSNYTHSNIKGKAGISWSDEAKNAASLNIKFDTLQIESYANWYKKLSSITNGINLKFKSAKTTDILLEGYILARSGNKEDFAKVQKKIIKSKDKELIGVYKQLGTL